MPILEIHLILKLYILLQEWIKYEKEIEPVLVV